MVFLKLGASAYGGPAMMAYLRNDLVGKRGWLSEQEFKEGIALCQVIPGAIVVQMCTYTGYRLRGPLGALVAGAAFILPAFFLMAGLSAARGKQDTAEEEHLGRQHHSGSRGSIEFDGKEQAGQGRNVSDPDHRDIIKRFLSASTTLHRP